MEVVRFHGMRRVKAVLLVLGIVAIAVSVYRIGPAPILEALARLTWWQLVLVCLPYAAIMAVDTLGWRFAFPRDPAPFHRLYGARLAGEALNLVTALGSMGGEAVKAWLIRRDVTYEESVPSVVIAKTTITIAQALFLLIGVALAWTMLATDSRVIAAMLWLLVVEVAAVAGFVGVQVAGIVGRAGRLLEWFGVVTPGDYARAARRRPARVLPPRLAPARVVHRLPPGRLAARRRRGLRDPRLFLGIPADLVTATVIEALGAGVRFATFLVPASLGAFESANAAAFEAMGLGAGAGLAFSFVRRARQLVWIAIGMLVLAAMGWRARRAGLQASVSSGTSSSTSS